MPIRKGDGSTDKLKKRRKKLGRWGDNTNIKREDNPTTSEEDSMVAVQKKERVQTSKTNCDSDMGDISEEGDRRRCSSDRTVGEVHNSDNSKICSRCGKALNVFESDFDLKLCFICQQKSKHKEKRSKVHWDVELKINEKRLDPPMPKRKPINHIADYKEPVVKNAFSKKFEGWEQPLTENEKDTRKVKQMVFHASDPDYMDEEGERYGDEKPVKKRKIRRRTD